MVNCCVQGCSNQSRPNKNVSYHKVLGEERKYKIHIYGETTAIGKSFIQNRIKSRNIFLHISAKISENFDIKSLRWTKQIYPKKQKKILRKDTLRISEVVVLRCSVKKVSLKILPAVYLHIIKIDIK